MPEDYVAHSRRHSLRHRMSAMQCPSDIIDQIVVLQTAGIGQSYGRGQSRIYSINGLKRLYATTFSSLDALYYKQIYS